MALMAFVAVSLFVAAFLIVNTFSMLVSQRSREFGLLRAVGATSRQVFAIVVGEAIAVGLLASAAGLGLGVGAAHGLHALLPALGIALPDAAIQVRGTVAVVSLATGTLVTLLAALVPAARAGRVPPVVAILGLSTGTKAGSRLVAALGGALAAAGAALVTSGPDRGRATLVCSGSAWAPWRRSSGWACSPGTSSGRWWRSWAGPGPGSSASPAGSAATTRPATRSARS